MKRFENPDAATKAPVVPAADRKVFADAYRESGFQGGLNWYRNMDANWARMEGVDHMIRVPCLMISAERDPILPPDMTRWMDALTQDLEKHVIPGVGHWVQWEAPDAVNTLLGGWLQRRFGAR
jgi:non-specific protein-tyrosine kinase